MATVDANLYKVPAGTLYQTSPNTQTGYVTNTAADNSIFTQQQTQATMQQTATTQQTTTAEPKKEKYGFFQGVGDFFKGIGKSVAGIAKALTTPKGILTAVALIGACCIPVVGPFIATGLAVYGGVKAAGKIADGIAVVASDATPEQKSAAMQDVGGGALELGLSAVGARAGLNGCKATIAAGKAGIAAEVGVGTTKVGAFMRGALKMDAATTAGSAGANAKAIGSAMWEGTKANAIAAANSMRPSKIKERFTNRWNKIQEKVTEYKNSTPESRKLARADKAQAKAVEKATKSMEKEMSKATKETMNANEKVENIQKEIKKLDPAAEGYADTKKALDTKLENATKQYDQAVEKFDNLNKPSQKYTDAETKFTKAEEAYNNADPKDANFKKLEADYKAADKSWKEQQLIEESRLTAQDNGLGKATLDKAGAKYDQLKNEIKAANSKKAELEAKVKDTNPKVKDAAEIELAELKTKISDLEAQQVETASGAAKIKGEVSKLYAAEANAYSNKFIGQDYNVTNGVSTEFGKATLATGIKAYPANANESQLTQMAQSGQLFTTPYTDAGAATTTSQPKTFGYDITTETPNYFDPNLQTGFNEAAYNNFMFSNGAYPQYQV